MFVVSMNDICAIAVTYGERWHLLERSIEAALDAGVDRMIVVDNGCPGAIEPRVSARFPDHDIIVERLADNRGSAPGFGAGLRRALKMEAGLLLLLDDDTLISSDSLVVLKSHWAGLASRLGRDVCAVAGWRRGHHEPTMLKARASPRRGSFLGFHVVDLPGKLLRRFRLPSAGQLPQVVVLETAPYSGLLLHHSVVERFGTPLEEFVLYGDDIEFTYRLTAAGGEIQLVTSAKLEEIEASWRDEIAATSALAQWLKAEDDLRTYYAFRNQAYFEQNFKPWHWLYPVNRLLYLFLLRVLARWWGAQSRYRLLCRALADARAGRLGRVRGIERASVADLSV